ncbi:T9SS type A sorting domain-containing protein [bacterium]|nr:T9SS type A sorting domain-containing protein [bacterium]
MKTLLLCFLAILALLLPFSMDAETIIPESIPSGTWTTAGNPYILEQSAVLPADSTLVIEEGVVVFADQAMSLTFYGGCQIIGTEQKPILFTSSTDGETWGGLRFWENDELNTMVWATVEYGGTYEPQLFGGGISIREANFSMRHSTVRYNHATLDGGGMLVYEADVAIDSCQFYGNIAERCGGAIDFADGAAGVFQHNLLWENQAENGGAIYFYNGDVIADHLTCYNNVAWQDNSVARWYFSSSIISNSILWDATGAPTHLTTYWQGFVEYSCVSDSTMSGPGLVFNDPLLLDPVNDDFRLTSNSPCIDAGDPDGPTDPDGSISDLGAIWFGTAEQPTALIVGLNDPVAEPGGTGILFLSINTLTNQPIFSLEGDLNLPIPPILEVTNVAMATPGPGSDAGWMAEWNTLESGISFACAGASALRGTGPLLAIEFEISPDAQEGEYPIFCTSIIANEGEPEVVLPGGTLTISQFPAGDVSLNHEVQAYDASMILRWLEGTLDLTDLQHRLGEVSGNDELTAFDASLILQRVSGAIDSFPVESGQPGPTGTATPSFALNSGQDGFWWLTFALDDNESVGSAEVRLHFDPEHVALEAMSIQMAGCNPVITPLPDGARLNLAFESIPVDEHEILSMRFGFTEPQVEGGALEVVDIRINDGSWQPIGEEFWLENTDVTEAPLPLSHQILTAWPNPFNPTLNINISIEKAASVEVRIVDLLGRQITTLAKRSMNRGVHHLQWNATGLSSGIYYLQVRIGRQTHFHKVVYLQ